MKIQHSAELIIATYNNPRALDLCLTAVNLQSTDNFFICVADDGSGSDTEELIRLWQGKFPGNRLRHIWQEDHGFQKNKILNKAIATSVADYLIFIDGDCIPSRGFVERHLQLRKQNTFLTGGVVRLDSSTTNAVTEGLITSGTAYSEKWLLRNRGERKLGTILKSNLLPHRIRGMLERITPVKRTWNGGNSSTWRRNLIEVNGFDEDLEYGAEDIELGYRLNNSGVEGRSVRYTTLLLHLEHPRDYANAETIERNRRHAKQSKIEFKTKTSSGITKNCGQDASP